VRHHFLLLISIIPLALLSSLEAAGSGGRVAISSYSPESNLINEPLPTSSLKTSVKAIFQRVIQARLFHSGVWTLSSSSQTPATVARTISSLQPSFVTGLLRISDKGELSSGEVEGFTTVRSAVKKENKGCRFDILLNAGMDCSGEYFVRRMKDISARLHPDAWTFYVAPDNVSVNPDVFEQGIAFAHSQGEMVGFDGPLSLIPEGVDYIVIRAWNFGVNRKQLDLLRTKQRVPLIVELPTTFGNNPSKEVRLFIEEMDTEERASTVSHLAENQNAWGYHLAYPIFYPLYPAQHAFDATKDNILLVMLRSLLTRYN
jgi:hypothetical protein